ncbi:MAG: NHL repeat-containing protein [Promethearchaeota archaeon CR_4]|nr:MAG: NHL repeat-containing protein [Candidatus Lokiarchaeota archaeon CR_4]
MKRIQKVNVLTLVGTLLVLAIVMPAILHPVGLRGDKCYGDVLQPRAASYSEYMYTISGFDTPRGVAVDSATGYLYVADTWNQTVQVFDNAGTYQYTIGTPGETGLGDDHFAYPGGVAVNATGHLYVADENNQRVQVFDNAGIYQYTIGTAGVSGTGNYEFQSPRGVAVNATGHLYVVDMANQRVQVFDNAGIYQYTIGTPGVTGTGDYEFDWPYAIAVNATGHLYVADAQNHRVQVFDNAGTYQYTIGTTGVSGPGNNEFYVPSGVAVNATGHLYVADMFNHRVQVFDNAGTYQDTIGVTGEYEPNDNDHFNYPFGVVVNATGHLYVADSYNDRIQVFTNGTLLPNPPTSLSISINDGAAETGTTSVTLTLSATGAEEMCFSNNGTTYTDWEVYNPSKSWILDEGPGFKTVYFKAKNDTIEAVAPVTGTILYVVPPTGLSITIDGGAAETANISVTLTLSATGATQMRFSNDGVTWSSWEPFATTKTWTLASGAGVKTIYLNARNSTIEAAAPVSDTITYNPPSDGDGNGNGGDDETGIPGFPITILLVMLGFGALSIQQRVRRTSHA